MATQEDKTTLNYRVVETENPLTGENVKRPVITNRPTYPLARVVRKAIDSGRIRGKYHDLVGIANGLMDEIQVLMNEGASINTGYQRYHLELTGQVGDDLRLTEANGLKTCITPMSDLKLNVSDFNWHRVDDNGIKLTLSTIKGEGSKLGQVMAGKKATINGRNLIILEGDSISAKRDEVSAECEVVESDEDHIIIVVPEAFDKAELAKKDIVFTVKSRCGDEEAPFQSKSIRATLLIDKTPKFVSSVGALSGEATKAKEWEDTMTFTTQGCNLEGAQVRYVLVSKETGNELAQTDWLTLGTTERNCEAKILGEDSFSYQCRENHTDEPYGIWVKNDAHVELKLADGTLLEYPQIFMPED